MTFAEDATTIRRAVTQAERAAVGLRTTADRRLVTRLEADLRRVREDLDDLVATAEQSPATVTPATVLEPVPDTGPEPVAVDDEREDEGLGGLGRAVPAPGDAPRRRLLRRPPG
jgi:hypothetical protein